MSPISISLLAICFGTVLGVFVGLALTYGVRPLRWIVRGYTDFIRGTPVLVLVLASYYVLGTIGLDLGPFQAGVLALAVFCSSHVGEIVRGALQAIPKGQTEAAKAIGLTFPQTFAYVLGPQALRQVPAGLGEHGSRNGQGLDLALHHRRCRAAACVRRKSSRAHFMSLEFYFFAGFLYFIINYAIERFGRYVERKTAVPS